MIQQTIAKFIQYGLYTELIQPEDAIYTANRLIELLQIGSLSEETVNAILTHEIDTDIIQQLESILNSICDYAYEQGIIKENSIGYRDLFDTKVMALLVDRPSNIISHFQSLYKINPKQATDYFYNFSQDTDYIRRYRIARDMKWLAHTQYGDLDITINLSKPEKDPRAIAAAKLAKQTSYPKCLLCNENVGFAGHLNHPARQNHRIIPIKINGSNWNMQYSPYVYYNEHCIIFNNEHIPMVIDRSAFAKMLDFVTLFPHYFVGSNADLPIVGGSILSHEHFQGGNYEFAMARAPIETDITFNGFEDVKAGIVRWPMSVIRISCADKERIVELSDKILLRWRDYTDESSYIFAETDGERHSTITPIARMRDGIYEMDLVLRNNITTEEHPLGLFHPHSELHHIKKENIGLIEVLGLAILPARLKDELEHLKDAILAGVDLQVDSELCKHADWIDELKDKYGTFHSDTIDSILKTEVGIVFMKVLEHAGVYKRTEEGKKAFLDFISAVNDSPT